MVSDTLKSILNKPKRDVFCFVVDSSSWSRRKGRREERGREERKKRKKGEEKGKRK